MAYIKFKELTKYFDFSLGVLYDDLPEYVTEYMDRKETYVMAYSNRRDYALFTNQRMILFDHGVIVPDKKIHIIPYHAISTSAIVFKPGKCEILISLDSGYQVRLDFIKMHHEEKEVIKNVYKTIMNYGVK